MRRSFINLRRVLFGVSCAVVFGFGATQALASPELARGPARSCLRTGYAYIPSNPDEVCPACPTNGTCDGFNTECRCLEW